MATATNSNTPTATAKAPTATYTCTASPTCTPTTAVSNSPCSGQPAWNGNFVSYSLGAQVGYDGEVYQCLQAHVSEPNWQPPAVPALWESLGPCGSTPTSISPVAAQPVLYPNPVTSGTATLQLPVENATNVTVQIITVAMRKVQTLTIPRVAGNLLPVQLVDKGGTALANGLYYFLVQAGGQRWMIKVLVLR